MIKRIVLAAALAALPATVFAQSMGPLIRDPAGGVTHDPALAWSEADAYMLDYWPAPAPVPRIKRDPAGGTMLNDDIRLRNGMWERRAPYYVSGQPIVIGTVLPSRGMVYRPVPHGFGAPGYRYTVVDDHAVIVEPRTRRVVRIIE